MKKSPKNLVKVLLPAILLLAFVGGLLLRDFLVFGHPPEKIPESSFVKNSSKNTIYPTIYVSGSSGNNLPNDYLVSHLEIKQDISAKAGLTFLDNTSKNTLDVTGEITADNKEPMISLAVSHLNVIGQMKGTSDGKSYVASIKKVVEYLQARYNVPWINLEGYSSGATGALNYMVDYGKSKDLPPVKKFLSLNGEFNTKTPLQNGETLEDVLKHGPRVKTPMYQYYEKNFKKIDKHTEVLLLGGDYNHEKKWDGTIPWADSFSVYWLFAKNGNSVSKKLYSTTLPHGWDFQNKTAIEEIRNFFYSNKKIEK